jgi:hypothetical protein
MGVKTKRPSRTGVAPHGLKTKTLTMRYFLPEEKNHFCVTPVGMGEAIYEGRLVATDKWKEKKKTIRWSFEILTRGLSHGGSHLLNIQFQLRMV